MGKYGKYIKTLKYENTTLPHYLLHDNWTVLEGLLLLTGLCPKTSRIEWVHPPNSLPQNEIPTIKKWVLRPLDAGVELDKFCHFLGQDKIYADLDDLIGKPKPPLVEPRDILDCLGFEDVNDEEAVDAVSEVHDIFSTFVKNFHDILKLWYSGDHGDKDRHPVQYFRQWAENKKIEVPWRNWVEKEELFSITPKETYKDPIATDLLEQRILIAENCFVFQGDGWTVKYHGEMKRLKNTEQVRYFAHLLHKPNYDYQPEELYYLVKGERIPDWIIEAKNSYEKIELPPKKRRLELAEKTIELAEQIKTTDEFSEEYDQLKDEWERYEQGIKVQGHTLNGNGTIHWRRWSAPL